MEPSRTQFGNARSCQIDSARVRFGGKSGRKGNSESPFSEASPSPQVRQVAQWESCHLEDWSPRMVIPFWNSSIWTRKKNRWWRGITDERSIVLLKITVDGMIGFVLLQFHISLEYCIDFDVTWHLLPCFSNTSIHFTKQLLFNSQSLWSPLDTTLFSYLRYPWQPQLSMELQF